VWTQFGYAKPHSNIFISAPRLAEYDSRVIFTRRCARLASKVPHRSLCLITPVRLIG